MDTPLANESWAQRNGFGIITPVIFWFFIAFILFQIVGGIIGVSLFAIFSDFDFSNAANLVQELNTHPEYLLSGNTAGQFIVIGFMSWLFIGVVKQPSEKRATFSRMNLPESSKAYQLIPLSIFLLVAGYPLLMLIQYFNAMLPQPEFLATMEKEAMRLITLFIEGDTPSWLIFFHIALTPAICEEIMFRGLIYTALERRYGANKAILISGILFGLYHLRLNQVVVLSLIGMLLAWLTYKSGSLIPAIVLHAFNNGLLSLSPRLFPQYSEQLMNTEEVFIPAWWVLVLSLAAVSTLFYIARSYIPPKPVKNLDV